MSNPMVGTDQFRTTRCEACGNPDVSQQKFVGVFEGGEHWRTLEHSAPCKLPCWGGGVGGPRYRTGDYHRDEFECPRCGPGEKVRVRLKELRECAQLLNTGVEMAIAALTKGRWGEYPNSLDADEILDHLRDTLGKVIAL